LWDCHSNKKKGVCFEIYMYIYIYIYIYYIYIYIYIYLLLHNIIYTYFQFDN
jgi:hypothetical protein